MSDKHSKQLFNVYLKPPQTYAKLSQLKDIGNQLQRTLNAVARNLTDNKDAYVEGDIAEATVGSLGLALRTSVPSFIEVDPDTVCDTLARDILDVRAQRFRPGMTPALLQQYRTLINTLKSSHVRVEYRYAEHEIVIDDDFRRSFEAASKERQAGNIEITGRIESLNIHIEPNQFRLYPKQPNAEGILCQFSTYLLDPIADVLKRKEIVRVTGTGYFAPVGLYPLRIILTKAPEPLVFNVEALRSYLRKTSLVPPGMTSEEYLQANREAAGFVE